MSMKNIFHTALIWALLPLLAACASGPTYKDLNAKEAPLAQNMARIYMYRAGGILGSGVQPSVKLDGKKVGDAVPGGYFFVDVPAGNHEISAATEAKRDTSFTVAAGETRYVRLEISMGFAAGHVSPILVDAAQGKAEIADCSFIGK